MKQRFKSIIRSFTDQEKAKLINYLLKSFHSLIDSSKSRLKPDFFMCKKQLAVFFMGVVHYFPELILSQLRSNAKSRIEMMELFKNFILYFDSLFCLFVDLLFFYYTDLYVLNFLSNLNWNVCS